MGWLRDEFWKLVDWAEDGAAGDIVDTIALIGLIASGWMFANCAGSIVDCQSAESAIDSAKMAVGWIAVGAACLLRVRKAQRAGRL